MINELGEVLELFCPTLSKEKATQFNILIDRISKAYPNYREQIVRQELSTMNVDTDNIEDMKYKAVISALIDLTQQGWQLEVHKNQLYKNIIGRAIRKFKILLFLR